MLKKIETNGAPAAIGPYSQAIAANGFLFVSGQIPIDPQAGKIVETSIEGQTGQVLANIEAILKSENLSWEHVVRCEIYLKNLSDFQMVNRLYGEKFTGPIKPARQTLGVSEIPLGALIEISCIACYNGLS